MPLTLATALTREFEKIAPRRREPGECSTPLRRECTLCFAHRLTYSQECSSKKRGIEIFWNSLNTGAGCAPLVASPLEREYRTITKRKVFVSREQHVLGLIGVDDDSSQSFAINVERCVIEPEVHNGIYGHIQRYFQEGPFSAFGKYFNYVILKGIEEITIIFNVNNNGPQVRKELNSLSKSLSKRFPTIQNVFLFLDEKRSRYYLSSSAQRSVKIGFQKIHGKGKVFHSVLGKKFLYSPTSFSQTNHSILERFISTAGELLALSDTDSFYDLYCGYGLFSLCLSGTARRIIGIEASRTSIDDARDNAIRNKSTSAKFQAVKINESSMLKVLSHETGPWKVLLDPPRGGTDAGVIEVIAAHRPQKVVHIFCNSEIIGKELSRWQSSGYAVTKAIPFDMFPGTDEVEFMVLLERIQ